LEELLAPCLVAALRSSGHGEPSMCWWPDDRSGSKADMASAHDRRLFCPRKRTWRQL